jgi:hypothetical protein
LLNEIFLILLETGQRAKFGQWRGEEMIALVRQVRHPAVMGDFSFDDGGFGFAHSSHDFWLVVVLDERNYLM